MNPSGPGLFLCGRLLIAASISDLVIGLFRDQLFPGLVLGGCKCPGIYTFLLDFMIYLHRGVYSLMVVCISVGLVVISSFSFFIPSIWFFSLFFFISLASVLSILLIFSKNQLLDSLIFF